ncbi:MAG: flp pilus-assembly TadE/G-like family protein [Cryobacterium sp.]|nr:flp pilus-assembly TadE/G-like family protein [Cryobacterium sp.]
MGAKCESDLGSGTILALGLAAAMCALFLALLPLGAIAVARSEAQGAADAAALAAADTIRGLNSGYPCARASTIAKANGAALVDCQADGVIVTVRVNVRVGEFVVVATATAGPPNE